MEKGTRIIWYNSKTDEINGSIERKFFFDEEFNSCMIRYADLESCVHFIESIPKDHLFLITTIFDAHHLLPLIHEMRQIDSVFLVSIDDETLEDLLSKYAKIIGCFNDAKTLIESVEENIRLAQKQTMVFSFYNQHKKPTRVLSKESALFLWFQLFKNALLNMPSADRQAKDDLVQFLQQRYRNNNKQMRLIEEFQRNYKADDAIRWYTGQPFLYRHVNKALRTEDLDQLYIFRFFISDLCKSLLQEFQFIKEYEPRVTLYRGTRITIEECQRLKENEGHLVSMNGFLSTSLSKDVALSFMSSTTEQTNQAVLFEIECDLSQVQTIVLAQIAQLSAIKSEDEVLIDIGAVFRIVSLELQENIILVKMKATDEGTEISKNYLEINQAELKEKNVRIIWGDLLLDMGHYDKALQYFRKIQALDGAIEDWQLHIHVGHVLSAKSLYKDAVEQYLRANELWEQNHSTQNVSILSHLSNVFTRSGLYDQALPILSEVLQIYESFPVTEHDRIYYHDVAFFLSRIGHCYFHKGNYDLAITYYNQAYNIRDSHYSTDHFESAEDLDQLAIIYRTKGDYRRALHCSAHTTSIYERILPPNHPKVLDHLTNIALTLVEQNKNEDALKYFRQVTTLISMTPSDALGDIAFTLDIMAQISLLEGDKNHAIELTQEALQIQRMYLSENHYEIANYLATLGNLLEDQNRHDEAMVSYREALNIYSKISSDGHPRTAIVLHGIGFIYQTTGDYEAALSHYTSAQLIYQKHFSPQNSDFIRLLLCIAEVHQLKGEILLAVEALKNCLTIIQKYCENNDPLRSKAYIMLADTYMSERKVSEALYAYEKGFSIEVDDEIEHYVYHVGYRLLMLSCSLGSQGKHQKARSMHKNALIIFEKYDHHGLFKLIEDFIEFYDDGKNSNETDRALDQEGEGGEFPPGDFSPSFHLSPNILIDSYHFMTYLKLIPQTHESD